MTLVNCAIATETLQVEEFKKGVVFLAEGPPIPDPLFPSDYAAPTYAGQLYALSLSDSIGITGLLCSVEKQPGVFEWINVSMSQTENRPTDVLPLAAQNSGYNSYAVSFGATGQQLNPLVITNPYLSTAETEEEAEFRNNPPEGLYLDSTFTDPDSANITINPLQLPDGVQSQTPSTEGILYPSGGG